jgi:hypothetical protein
LFVLFLRIGITILGNAMQPSDNPHLIDGMVDATQMLVFHQDPSMNGAKTIYRSVNGTEGIEFTWSDWIFVNNLEYLNGQYRHVFFKGNNNLESSGLNFPNNAPGLYIAPSTNALIVMMNTYDVINQEIVVPDLPLNKWVNVIIRCRNTQLDVYINGTIARSLQLTGVPKQNYGDVYVAANGGFAGNISNLWYYNTALGTSAIQSLVRQGPTTRMIASPGSGMTDSTFNYLSLRWYLGGAGDMFNGLDRISMFQS